MKFYNGPAEKGTFAAKNILHKIKQVFAEIKIITTFIITNITPNLS